MTDHPDPPADLVALVGSRIAHDLANPIGAIANGVELLGLTGPADSPELALIHESVENAKARIKAFRLAFGAARDGQTVPVSDLTALYPGEPAPRALAVDWQEAGEIPRAEAKLVLLALMCLETAMPWGGNTVARRHGGGWQIAGMSERIQIDPGLWERFGTPADPLAAGQVHFALIGREAAAQGRRLGAELGEGRISIRF